MPSTSLECRMRARVKQVVALLRGVLGEGIDDIPRTVKEDMVHLGVVHSGEGRVFPRHRHEST